MPIALRTDFNADNCRLVAKKTKDGPQARRLLALAAIYEGASRSEAARIGGVTVQIVRDWVVKFNVHGPSGLVDRRAPGPSPRLTSEHRKALAALVEAGPTPAIHGVVRWRLIDLPVDLGGVPGEGRQADPEPGTAQHGLSQAFGPRPPSRSGQRSNRRF